LSRILALDYGSKRIGIAVTDPLRIIASGLVTLDTREIWTFFEKYFLAEKVELLVIGYPLHKDGNPMDITVEIDHFITDFEKKHPQIPVVKEDERFTSKMAVEAMIAGGMKKMDRRDKKMIDKISATLILQNYLHNLQP
jgi:putative holliday junction resolvase